MPPLFVHDPLEAVQRTAQPGWWLASAMALSVACEWWVIALLGLALYAWLERDVPSVIRGFVPLGVAILAGLALWILCARAGSLAGWSVRAVPSGHALWGATFAAYTLRVYGTRWGGVTAALALAGGGARIFLGSNGIPSVSAGWILGAAMGVAAFEVAARALPSGPAGRRRRGALTAPPKVA